MRIAMFPLLLALGSVACSRQVVTPPPAAVTLSGVSHVIVIYLENHSFDNLYGEFPRAEGLAGRTVIPQVDADGVAYPTLPEPANGPVPQGLANAPFSLTPYLSLSTASPDLTHEFYTEQAQINNGAMNRFVALSSASALAVGYYPTAQLPLASEAVRYTLCDAFFHGVFGGSFLNHFWLIAAAVPTFPNAPSSQRIVLDSLGRVLRLGAVTPDGHVVNNMEPHGTLHARGTRQSDLVPLQTLPTIGDRLSAAGVTWTWYAEGWNNAVAGRAPSDFEYHHQPFLYVASFAEGTRERVQHLADLSDFDRAASAGNLPAVSFVQLLGRHTEHPGSSILAGEIEAKRLIDEIRNGPNWHDSVIIVTYDENGGFWDHVAPPVRDAWGPGTRVPALIISPFAKSGFVDHTPYETASILSFIETRWKLAPLSSADAQATPLTGAFNFAP